MDDLVYIIVMRAVKTTLLFQQLFVIHVPAFRAKTMALVLPMAFLMFVLVPQASLELIASVSSICVIFCMFVSLLDNLNAAPELNKSKAEGRRKGQDMVN